jgi:trigger factor
MVQDLKDKLEEQGKSLASTGKSGPELRESYREEAERLVKAQILLMKIAKNEGVEVSRDDVLAYLRQEAIRNNQDFETLVHFYEDNNLMFALRDKLMADRAVDFIYENAEIEMVPPEREEGAEGGEKAKEAQEEAE